MTDPERRNLDTPPRAPRWVKMAGVGAALVVAVVIVLLVSGGDHGPGRHVGGGSDSKTHTAPSGSGHTPPPGAHE